MVTGRDTPDRQTVGGRLTLVLMRARPRVVLPAVWTIAALIIASAAANAQGPTSLTAVHDGVGIPLANVSKYHCHDGVNAVIRCFDTAAERDADLIEEGGGEAQTGVPGLVYYVTFYWDADYGGASFTASGSYSDLRLLDWNDAISSFKSLTGGHPKWWRDINFGGDFWQWSAGAWVPYVGNTANDQFSSVANVP